MQSGSVRSEPIVRHLGSVMELGQGSEGRRLVVEVVPLSEFDPAAAALDAPGAIGELPVACYVPDPETSQALAVATMRVSAAVVLDAMTRGALLLHGALVEREGAGRLEGVVLAGRSGVGKTTACDRLPSPWRPLCDDATLVVRGARGGDATYQSHPWPTWSRFATGGPGGSWDVQHAVPLRAVFFLEQAAEDGVRPLNRARTAALLASSSRQSLGYLPRWLSPEETRAFHLQRLENATALSREVPGYILSVSLHGSFWRLVEGVLAGLRERDTGKRLAAAIADAGTSPMRVAYSGPSMNPTLREPEVLVVKPYGERPVRAGDVVCFQPPGSERTVVHRVVGRASNAEWGPRAPLRTRGDNNARPDPWLIFPQCILGQVVGARRGTRFRAVPGGARGRLTGGIAVLANGISRQSVALAGRILRAVARDSRLDGGLAAVLRPRAVLFRLPGGSVCKLLLGGREIGSYLPDERRWRIDAPFRPFVDARRLPHPAEDEGLPGT